MANDTPARDTERARELMKEIGFAMLVTRDGDKLRARPMRACLERENNAIYFLSDARRHKDEEIPATPISTCRSPMPAKAWWDSAEDPNIRVLKITPDGAEFWDSPGSVISYVKMAATPGNPTEPPQEDPPGNPRPEVPPPMREPGEPPQPDELPGSAPEELPVRGPDGPRTPSPATDEMSDLAGDALATNSATSNIPQGTM